MITGAHRTWLDPSGRGKAPIDTPRRAMGHLLGQRRPLRRGARCHGGRRRHRDHAVAPMRPARPCRWRRRSRPRISPPSCSRRRCAGSTSPATTIRPATARWRRLIDRASEAGIEAIALSPRLGDFNEDLRTLGIDALRAALRVQIAPEDVARFMELAASTGTGDEVRGGAGLTPHPVVVLPVFVGEDRAHGLLRGRSGRQTARPGNGGWPTIFRRRASPPLHREAK